MMTWKRQKNLLVFGVQWQWLAKFFILLQTPKKKKKKTNNNNNNNKLDI
jgi:hypothetical protein